MMRSIIYAFTALIIAASFIYFAYLKPHQVKADCWTQAYSQVLRPHENDHQWATDKQWLPDPNYSGSGDPVTDAPYVWIYPDQDITRIGEEARAKEKAQEDANFKACLSGQGY